MLERGRGREEEPALWMIGGGVGRGGGRGGGGGTDPFWFCFTPGFSLLMGANGKAATLFSILVNRKRL